MGLSFSIAAGPRQCIHSRIRVLCDWRSDFTVSDSRLPFLSPPTTRRATVEVFDPASDSLVIAAGTSMYKTSVWIAQKTPLLTVFCSLFAFCSHYLTTVVAYKAITYQRLLYSCLVCSRCLAAGLNIKICSPLPIELPQSGNARFGYSIWFMTHQSSYY
jgi:hypothetical protein